jgi:hypothetical protein
VYALMAAPTDEDRAAAAYLASRLTASDAPAQPTQEPVQRANGQRMPSTSAAWTFRDRSNQ